jgi:hypothetical protein
VAPAVSARARHFQVLETAASVFFPAQSALAEAPTRPRLIPHHLLVGEQLLDRRAGGQQVEFAVGAR